MHHSSYRQIQALGAAIMERVSDEMRERVQTQVPNEFSFVVRKLENGECLGMASFENADSASPELEGKCAWAGLCPKRRQMIWQE
jgi:hypothetical protein